MDLKLGHAIKRLRTERGVTQEQLGEAMGVSYQAVSKWETGATLPDVALLPELAVYFGVDIDALFSIDDSDKLKRIDRVIEGHEQYTPENVVYIRSTLEKMLEKDPKNVDLLKRLVDLHWQLEQEAEKEKKRIKKRINQVSPFEPYGHTSKRGYWRYHEEIGLYEAFTAQYPDWQQGWIYLAENCIAGNRLDKAEEAIKRGLALGADSYLTALQGDICQIRGQNDEAMALWDQAVAAQTERADTVDYIAEKCASLGMTEKAISLWESAYEQDPNSLSPLYSLAFLYHDLGQYAEATCQWEEIIKRLREDWGYEEGSEMLCWPREEIRKLREKMGN